MDFLSAVGGFLWGAFTASLNIMFGEFLYNASFMVVIAGLCGVYMLGAKVYEFFAGGKVMVAQIAEDHDQDPTA